MKDICFGYFKINTPKKNGKNRIGYICIAVSTKSREVKESGVRKYYEYLCSFAFCSPNDQFQKKVARDKASGRLKQFMDKDVQSPYDCRILTLTPLQDGKDLHDIMKDAVTSRSFIRNAPVAWFKKAIKRDAPLTAGLKDTSPSFRIIKEDSFRKAAIVTSAIT